RLRADVNAGAGLDGAAALNGRAGEIGGGVGLVDVFKADCLVYEVYRHDIRRRGRRAGGDGLREAAACEIAACGGKAEIDCAAFRCYRYGRSPCTVAPGAVVEGVLVCGGRFEALVSVI